MKSDRLTIMHDSEGKAVISMRLTETITTDKLNKLVKHCEDGKFIDVDIGKYREKRSKDANSYYHVLKRKIADVLGSSEDEIGYILLKRYGRSVHTTCLPSEVNNHLAECKYGELVETVVSNGKEVSHVVIYRSSASYNSKEMSLLIEGTVSECVELEIETKPPEEIARLIAMIDNGTV